MSKQKTRLVEVYGSLLKAKQREKILEKGMMREIGKVKRRALKLSFDRKSVRRNEAVLNLVHTGNLKDAYYTTVFEVDDDTYAEVMKREMGEENAEKWKQGKQIDSNSYRPMLMRSKFGKTEVFVIPEERRKPTPTHWEANYVREVRKGIAESYKDCPLQMESNLKALKRAVEESKSER